MAVKKKQTKQTWFSLRKLRQNWLNWLHFALFVFEDNRNCHWMENALCGSDIWSILCRNRSRFLRAQCRLPGRGEYQDFSSLWHFLIVKGGFPGSSAVKEPACQAGDSGSIPDSGRSPGEGDGNPLQYSCLGNPMDREAWWATVHGGHKESDTT